MPSEADSKTGRQEPEEPSGVEVGTRKAFDVPGAAEAARVLETRGQLTAERDIRRWFESGDLDSHVCEGGLHSRTVPGICCERCSDAVG